MTTPGGLARQLEVRDNSDFICNYDEPDVYKSVYQEKMRTEIPAEEFPRPGRVVDYPPDFTWKQLYAKIDLEECIYQLHLHQDFKGLYARLRLIGDLITNLTLYITPCSHLKSGYYYLCSVLGFVNNLRVLTIKTKHLTTQIPYKAAVNLKKGLGKLNKDGACKIEKIRVKQCHFLESNNQLSEAMLEVFNNIPRLRSIDLEDTNILALKESKFANFVIVNNPNLTELRVVRAAPNKKATKAIADGLMRAKKLEFLQFRNQASCSGINNLLYNLAFAPKLTVLDLSDNQITDKNIFTENLSKLLAISPCIEYLAIAQLSVMNNLPMDFFKAIGENITLSYLDLTRNYSNNKNVFICLAQAVAINASRRGALEQLFLNHSLARGKLEVFLNSMWTSEYLQEVWYGDSTKAEKMGGEKRDRKYLCNLRVLELDGAPINTVVFKYEKYMDEISKVLPDWLRLFTNSPKLETLSLRSCQLNQFHFESLRALYDKGYYLYAYNQPKTVQCKLKHLRLSCNNVQKIGAKYLTEVIKKMTSLEVLELNNCGLGVGGALYINQAVAETQSIKLLSLYSNKIQVDGARNLGAVLTKNRSVEFLDIGGCNIKDEGLRVIGEALRDNKNSALRCLAVRFNMLTDKGFSTLIANLNENKDSKLSAVLFNKNEISPFSLDEHITKAKKFNPKIFVDFFRKKQYLDEDRMARTLWVEAPNVVPRDILKFIYDNEIGVVVNLRSRASKPVETVSSQTPYYLVEFAHPLSVDKALILASKGKARAGGRSLSLYKAGSSTFHYDKNCKSNKYMNSIRY